MFMDCDVVISAVDVVAEDVNRTAETTATNMLLTTRVFRSRCSKLALSLTVFLSLVVRPNVI